MGDKIKNSKATTKILSVVLAVILWLVLEYTDKPQITRRINNVDITFKGIDVLKEKGLIPVRLEKNSRIDIEVKGSRMGIIETMENVTASADLSSVSVKGTRIENVNVETGVAGVYVIGRGKPTVTVEIDEIGEKTVPVEVVHTGSEKNKQTIAVSGAEPDYITLSGAKSELEMIEKAVISIPAQDIDKKTVKDMQYILYTTEGEKHTPDTVRADVQTVSVTSGLYPRKNLPVRVEIAEEYKNDYTIDAKIKSKNSVDVGVVSLDNDVDEVIAVFDPQKYESEKNEYEIELSVPEGVYIQDASKVITAEVSITKKSTEKLELDVEIRNIPKGLKAEKNYRMTVELGGTLPEIDESTVKAYVDAGNLDEGEYEADVHIEGPGSVSQLHKDKIRIRLVKQEG